MKAVMDGVGLGEGGVRTAGRKILPAVGLALFVLVGCRFGEPVTSSPAPPGATTGAALSAEAAEEAAFAETPDGLLLAEVRRRESVERAAGALFAISATAPEAILRGGEAEAIALADEMSLTILREWVAFAPKHPRFHPPLLVELATRRFLVGDLDEARAQAEAALALSPSEEIAERARSILEGRAVAELGVAASIGVMVSSSGSPALRQISEEMLEGIEVALALEERMSGVPIRLLTFDDRGTTAGVSSAMTALNQERVAGILGPIYDPMVAAAAGLRTSAVPLLSPSARVLPAGATGVMSLSGVDLSASRALADLVLGRGVRQVVLLHPATAEMQEEARGFREAYQASGGVIQRVLTYPAGTAGFASVMQEIASLSPRGLVILLPPGGGDIQQLASQITFYGVHEIPNLVRFGNESWTSSAALQAIDPRHTNGVFAVSRTTEPGELGQGWEEFRVAYEEHFRRTLRSSAPAFGFDSARLLIQAARSGGGVPERTLEALGEIRDFRGATGTLSVVNGRIERRYFPVRIENRLLVPTTP